MITGTVFGPGGSNATNNVTITTTTPESNTGDNADDAQVTIVSYDLALTKVLTSSGTVMSGDAVTFTITLYNQGTLPANNIQLTDYIPAGLTLNDTNWTIS